MYSRNNEKGGFVTTISSSLSNSIHSGERKSPSCFKILGKKLHFVEYRFERHELRQFMVDGGFDVVESLPNDYRLDSNEYSFGMYTDWPWLRDRKVKYKLNLLGRITKAILKFFNPFWAVSGIMVVAKKPSN